MTTETVKVTTRNAKATKPFKLKSSSKKVTKAATTRIKRVRDSKPSLGGGEENPYLETLLDPFNTEGAKIPDDQCYPSASFTLSKKFALSSNSAGLLGVSIGQARDSGTSAVAGALVPQNDSVAARQYVLGQGVNSTATTANLFPGVVGNGDFIFWDNWTSSSSAVQTAFDSCRLVSMGLAVNYTGAPLNAQGRITLAYTPKNQAGQSVALSLDAIQAFPGSKVIPINELDGAIVLYKPVDYTSWTYKHLTSYHDLSNSTNRDEFCDGTLWMIVDGLDTTVANTMQLYLVAHYEGLPRRSTWSLVEPSPSRHDPLMLASAMNIVQEAPTTIGSAAVALDTVMTTPQIPLKLHSKREGKKKASILDDLESGLKSAWKVGKAVAPLAQMIARAL